MEPTQQLMKTVGIDLRFGGVKALTDVSVFLGSSEILAIIGPNGAGKSCLLNCMNGFYHPHNGQVFFQDLNITDEKPYKRSNFHVNPLLIILFQRVARLEPEL